MPSAPKIFVSHSSLDNDLTRSLCQRLESPGNDELPRYEVLVDFTKLEPGKPWPKQLHEFMARCQAAVILLTRNAVSSPWVLKEATILAWRLSLDRNFHLFTIRFPNVTDELLEIHKFNPLLLNFIQQIDNDRPEAIASKIRDAIGLPKRKKTPFDRLAGRLTDLFTKVGDNTLKDVAETIRIDTPQWKPDVDLRAQYVEEISRHIICENLGGYEGVEDLIDELSLSTSAETVKQILWIIAPHWVDAEAAGKLVSLPGSDPRQAAVINGAYVADFSASMYVRRAYPLSRRYQVIQTGGGSAGNLVEHFTSEICDWVRRNEVRADDNDTIIKDLKKRQSTMYAIIPPPLPPVKEMSMLHDRFPKISFILWTGETLERDDNRTDVELLLPEIDLDLEDKERECYRIANDIIKSIAGA